MLYLIVGALCVVFFLFASNQAVIPLAFNTQGTDRNKFINVTSFDQLQSTVTSLVDMVKCGNTTWIPASPPQPQPMPQYTCPVGAAVANSTIMQSFVGTGGGCPKLTSVLCGFNGNQNELVFTNQLKDAVKSGRLNCTVLDSSKTVINFKVSNATYKAGSSEIIGFTLQIDQQVSVDGYKMDNLFVKASTGGKGYSPAANNVGFSNGYFIGDSNYEISHVAVCVSRCPTQVLSTPTKRPTKSPTKSPTKRPTKRPTKSPTKRPTKRPTKNPTKQPSSTDPDWECFDDLTTFESSNNGWSDPRTTDQSRRVTDISCPSGNSCWALSGPSSSDIWDRRVYKYLNVTGNPKDFKISFSYNVTGASGTDRLAIEEYCVEPAEGFTTTVATFRMNSTDMVQNVAGRREVVFGYSANCVKAKILCTWYGDLTNDRIFLDDIQIYRRILS